MMIILILTRILPLIIIILIAPFGGFKESGIGRELGDAGLHNYMEMRTVIVPIDR